MISCRCYTAHWTGVRLELRRDIDAMNPGVRTRTKPGEDSAASKVVAPDVYQHGEVSLPCRGRTIRLTVPLTSAKSVQCHILHEIEFSNKTCTTCSTTINLAWPYGILRPAPQDMCINVNRHVLTEI